MPSLETSGLVDLVYEERFAQSETLTFTVRADDARAALIGEDMEVRWRGRVFFVFEPRKFRSTSGAALVEYECPALWARLADTKKVGTLDLFGLTVAQGLDRILDGTGWTGEVTDDVDLDATWYLSANDASVLDLVRKWAKITGTEVQFDTLGKIVALRQQLGAERGAGFRYGRNMKTVERRSNPPAVTRLYPFGRDGVGIVTVEPEGKPYVEDFTFYTAQGLTEDQARARYLREEIWTDTSFTEPAGLYAGALARLALRSAARLSYEMAVVDLAELTHLASDVYAIGDRVRVYDGDLGINVTTRVVRIVRRPLEPWASEVELSYLPPAVPDPSVSSGRADPGADWMLFESSSNGEHQIRNGTTVLARLGLTTIPGAEWVVGYSINGIGVGAGTVTLTPTDDTTGLPLVAPVTLTVADGVPFHWSFTLGDREVAQGDHTLVVRAASSGAGIGVNVASTPDGSALWVLARGTTGRSVTLANTQRFDYTGAVQTFTVPDDVYEVTIETVGAPGGIERAIAEDQAGGCRVSARFPVVPGTVLDVYVGGWPGMNVTGTAGGWPDGGAGDAVAGANGAGGGGSSKVLPHGITDILQALIVAGAGGGSGQQFTGNRQKGGGAGFYTGSFGEGLNPGFGGTQTAGGAPGAGGTAGSLGQGGLAADATNAFTFPPGGGGGGFYGGGGGGTNNLSGAGNGGGGGGGSGWIDATGFDLFTEDAVHRDDHGYVVFSWDSPVV